MTTVVVATIVSVMNGRASAEARRVPVESRGHETRPPTPIKPVTAV